MKGTDIYIQTLVSTGKQATFNTAKANSFESKPICSRRSQIYIEVELNA